MYYYPLSFAQLATGVVVRIALSGSFFDGCDSCGADFSLRGASAPLCGARHKRNGGTESPAQTLQKPTAETTQNVRVANRVR